MHLKVALRQRISTWADPLSSKSHPVVDMSKCDSIPFRLGSQAMVSRPRVSPMTTSLWAYAKIRLLRSSEATLLTASGAAQHISTLISGCVKTGCLIQRVQNPFADSRHESSIMAAKKQLLGVLVPFPATQCRQECKSRVR
jgi:hypothetical protein